MCRKKNSLIFICFFFVAMCLPCGLFCGCKQKTNVQISSQFADNNNYYLGLKAQKEGNLKEAENFFNKCIKKGSGLPARRSLEYFCSSEDIQQKISAAKSLVETYDDEKALLMAARIFSEHNEPSLLISTTNKINLKTSDNELIRLRLEAQNKRGDSSFKDDFYDWFFSRPISLEHSKFFSSYLDDVKFDARKKVHEPEFESFWERKLFLMNFRIEIYKKNYGLAEAYLPIVQSIIDESADSEFSPTLITEQLMSDIGKIYLYGKSSPAKSAKYLQSEAEKYKGSPIEFYCLFYVGRLYDKAGGNNSERIAKSFISAVECVDALLQATKHENAVQTLQEMDSGGQNGGNATRNADVSPLARLKDNALWYLFKTSLKSSVGSSISYIEKYVTQISDPYYYDDFFDLFSPLLLSERKYKEIGELYKMMKGYASDEATAKYAYIYARLLEEGIYKGGKDEIQEAYATALNSATDMYYKVMVSERLGYYDFEKEKLFCTPRKSAQQKNESQQTINPEVEQLLNGYAFFGFPEKIYPDWVKLGSPVLSIETTINLCKLLRNCSNGNDDYFMQSLRIAAKTANYSPLPLTLELLEYVYPKNYEEFVVKYCDKYQLQKPVLWALIRSESFFDPDVKSSANAIGLCQLMPSTGKDIAHRLRRSDYDLTDPETSIEFGAYYLDNLIGRLDDSYLDAFFAYNAGISRVRKWKKSSAQGFGVKTIPEDLFLETLPYAETREYGRKLVAATEMYEWLYFRH